MGIHVFFGLLSGVIASAGFIPYIVSVLRKRTKPHPISWTLWAIVGFLILISYWGSGARETIWLALINFLGPLTVAFFSIRYWDRGFTRFDYACLGIGLFGVLLWIIYRSAPLALTFSIAADLFANLPTIKKSYADPKSENLTAWIIFVSANLISLLAIRVWTYGVALYPIYQIISSGSVLFVVLFKKPKVN